MRSSLIFVNAVAIVILAGLFIKSLPILDKTSLGELLLSSSWHPLKGEFGFYPFIISTIEVTTIAMTLAIPVCLLAAIFLSEYAHARIREFLRLIIDILAGIPSVVYGLCGVIVVVPFVKYIGQLLGYQTTGYSLLSGGIVLAVMVSPFIISVSVEVLRSVPFEARESTLALGATKWEAIKYVVLKSSLRGIIAAVVLGFSRAFGETIAVLMVVGNVAAVPQTLFDPAYPLPALIANNYGEMMSIPLYDSALLLAALVLMLVVGIFSLTAHFTLLRMGWKSR
ncbi:MAG: phosphate ABC transporter permease subunit PstC [Deltaproteobacteria bacterium HGW-Deltaproteobacteria-6]|nr:MAG: phosphate ABC transporter permease subunit PstC [Deltaproteobacteria bacterium HGW-Deltaproteobacteria-6]